MGLLSLGTPLSWSDAAPLADHVRTHGITQFLHIWDRLKSRRGDVLLWGDEVEYIVVSFDHENKNARLSLRQAEILDELADKGREGDVNAPGSIPTFHPEYGRYMLESTPGAPYSASFKDLLGVEGNMRLRRKIARSHLRPNELPITLTSFPRLGVKEVFTDPHYEPKGEAGRSLFLPDEIINPHARFPTLTANIRKRRRSKVAINMPIFHDEKTPRPFIDASIDLNRGLFPEDKEAKNGAALPDHIYMDAMGFGMGCCCLQITFQACSVAEARRVYDALVPVGPIMLALTAASPAYRGYLSDVDCRWNVISGSVDDRTPAERGLEPVQPGSYVIPKSRYDSVDSYISADPLNRPEYNDNPLPINEEVKGRLLRHGIDEVLANHIAHLFIRDPLVIFSEMIDQDDTTSSDHFENIQSTNWQTMRFKPPPPGSNIGWRVEFRSMEVQVTDFENAAFSVFIVLLTRAILSFGVNFYIPISKVDVNMQRAHRRDAVRQEKFFFRKNIFRSRSRHSDETPCSSRPPSPAEHQPDGASRGSHTRERGGKESDPKSEAVGQSGASSPLVGSLEDEYDEFTMEELICGKDDEFPGLLGLCESYLDSMNIDVATRFELGQYLDLVRKRADGTLQTTAAWMRDYIRFHPAYDHDSVVKQEINYDMIRALDEIEQGIQSAPTLLPEWYAHRRRATCPEDLLHGPTSQMR